MTDPLIWNAAIKAAANAVAQSAWKHCGSDNYSRGMDHGAMHQNKTDYEAILALAKSAPDLRAAVAGMVVPLEWKPPIAGFHAAILPFGGKLEIMWNMVHGVETYILHPGTPQRKHFKTLEAAKAAAQADYTHRILAALGLEVGE